MKVFLDDERVPPNHTWVITRTAESAIKLLELGGVEVISLDHDLGEQDLTGYDVLLRIEELQQEQPDFPLPIIQIHTANPGARVKMEMARDTIYLRGNKI